MSFGSILDNLRYAAIVAIGLIVGVVLSVVYAGDADNVITEVSGITRYGGKLLLVSDDVNGCYFEMKMDDISSAVIPIDPAKLKRIKMKGCEGVGDFESITVLADGRVAVLSEDMHALYSQTRIGAGSWGVLVQFSQSVTEFGNRGLEGAAALPMPDGSSQVAVVWEGGYPALTSLPDQLQNSLGHSSLQPILVITNVPRNAMGLLADDTASYRAMHTPKLKESGSVSNQPLLVDSELPKATDLEEPVTPFAQRFRSPDLVWHVWQGDDGADTGLIVLLTSENAPLRGSGAKREFKYKKLQRYDLQGRSYGTAIEINDIVKPIFDSVTPTKMKKWSERMRRQFANVKTLLDEQNWENVNWEGLEWFVRGQSLILVYDGVPADPPFAVVIPIPDSWK